MARFRPPMAVVPSTDPAPARRRPTRQPEPLIEPWIAAGELGDLLGVSTDWVYENAASGELPSYVFGGHRRFRLSEVEVWASEHAHGQRARRNVGRRAAD
jgi:excisionase family DNA binding protein